jgi:TolB-like protein
MSTPPEMSLANVRRELDRIVSSSAFNASPRNRQFLIFVVEETLAGYSNHIKAYTVATRVFGRGDDFDPLLDSIVRIEAARLRRALEHFYLKEGDGEGIRIAIPKGTYVPDFQFVGETADTARPPSAQETDRPSPLHDLGPRILIQPFEQQDYLDAYPKIGRAFTRRLISALTRFTELFVYGADTTERLEIDNGAGIERDTLAVDYIASGTVTVSDEDLQVDLLLNRARDGRFVWAYEAGRKLKADLNPPDIDAFCAEIAGQVARIIAQRDGILDSQARESAGDSPQHFAGYMKLMAFHDYWRSLDPTLFEPVRCDLEQAIVEDPRFAAAYACLSMIYSNAARYGIDVSSVCQSPLDRALDLARKAIHLAPSSSRAYHARAIVEWFSGKSEQSIATLDHARSLNPNDSELLAEMGFRHAMRMDWKLAVPLIEEAYIRNPLQPAQYRMAFFLYHFAEERYAEALRWADATDAPGIPYIHVAAAAALSKLGRLDEAYARLQQVDRLAPDLRRELYDRLIWRQIHPDLVATIVEAVGHADPGQRPPLGRVSAGRARGNIGRYSR